MIAIRAAKIAMIAAIALFATLVAFGNITDYDTNLAFVQPVLDRRVSAAPPAPRGRLLLPSCQDLRGDWPDARLPVLANWLHDDRRRMVRDVAIQAVGRRPERVPVRDSHYRGVDLRGVAGWGARSVRTRREVSPQAPDGLPPNDADL